ncbi:MAG: hypothetical protein WCS93_00900 [Candidatus Delongbacteria bacterium]
MNILKNINVLLAKLTEQQYKPYKELYLTMKEEYDKRYDHIFGVGNNRLYLDDTIRIDLIDYLDVKDLGSAYHAINNILHYCDDFYYFKDNYYDFACNRIYDKNNREYRLTKLLQLLITKKLKNITEEQYEDILERVKIFKLNFKKDLLDAYALNLPPKSMLTDSKGVNLSIVVSRDPYDIIGMSTDRRWSSCMRLPNDNDPDDYGGQCFDHLQHDIRLGTLVAYLIEPTDKNIDKPYARIAIKPHHNIEKKSVYLFSEDRVYSDNTLIHQTYENFKSVVDKFLFEVQDESEGIFMLPDQLYNDSNSRVKTQGNLIKHIDFDYMFDIDNGKKIYKNEPVSRNYENSFDIHIINNLKYNEKYDNNLVTVVENEIIEDSIYLDDYKKENLYSFYITNIKEPIQKHIARVDISMEFYFGNIHVDRYQNKIIVDYPKIYIEKLCVKKELKDDEDFILDVIKYIRNIMHYSCKVFLGKFY